MTLDSCTDSVAWLITENGVTKLAEIGVYACNLANQILKRLESELKEYYLIDHWKPCEGIGSANFIPAEKWEELYRRACRMQIQFETVKTMRLESTEAAKLFPDGRLDMAFIDASHLYNAVVSDIKAWKPKIKSGGILSGHDYGGGWPEVVKAVDDILGKPNRLPGCVWWIRV